MSSLRMGWTGWIESRWDSLRSSYWFVPTLMAVLAAALAQGLIALDRDVPAEWQARLPAFFGATAEGVRSTLGVVAGSMITVTGVVFSITIVALTLASNQFGPRLLRNFMRDPVNQLVLGTFVATFLYSLLVLRAVQTQADGTSFVPHIAAAGAVALGVTSLFVLILFIHHAATSIQASTVIAAVSAEVQAGIDQSFPDPVAEAAAEPEAEAFHERLRCEGVAVRSACAGYVRVIDTAALLEIGCEHDWRIGIAQRPGAFAARGSVLARVLGPASEEDEALAGVAKAFVLGDHRTPVQDVLLPVEQLAELAVRALSPGVNDPRSAVACIHRLGDALAALAARADPACLRSDDEGEARLLLPETRFGDVLSRGFDPIRRYGAGDADVCVAMLAALTEAAGRGLTRERGEQVRQCAEEIHAAAQRAIESKHDRGRVEEAQETLVARLTRA